MAAKLQATFDSEAVLIPDGKGIFDVSVNGERVYSKHQTGTFPDEDQLVEAIASIHVKG